MAESMLCATDETYAKALLRFLDADREARPALSLCDVTLIAGERKFRAHRTVLAAGSVYFRRLFSASPCGSAPGEERLSLAGGSAGTSSAVYNVEIAGVEPGTFELVLSFLYTASVHVDAARARAVRALGRALGVPFLAALPSGRPAQHAARMSGGGDGGDDVSADGVLVSDNPLGEAVPRGEVSEGRADGAPTGDGQAGDGTHSDEDDVPAIVGVVSPVDNGLGAVQSVCHLSAYVEEACSEGEEAGGGGVRVDEPERIEASEEEQGTAGGAPDQQELNADFSEISALETPELAAKSREQGGSEALDTLVSISITAVCHEGKSGDVRPNADPGENIKNGTRCEQDSLPLEAPVRPTVAKRITPLEATIKKLQQGVEKHDKACSPDRLLSVQAKAGKLQQGVGTNLERSPQGSSPAGAVEGTSSHKGSRAASSPGLKRGVSNKRPCNVAEDGSPVLKSFRTNLVLGRLAEEGPAAADRHCDAAPKWSLEKLRVKNASKIWCDECGQVFRTVRALKRHGDVYHSANRPYPCAVCGKRFLTSYKAWTHRRTQHAATLGGGLEESSEEANSRVFLVIPPFVSGALDGQAEPDAGDRLGDRGADGVEEGRAPLGLGRRARAERGNRSAARSQNDALETDSLLADAERADVTNEEISSSEQLLQTEPADVKADDDDVENAMENVETTVEGIEDDIKAVTQDHVLETTSEIETLHGGAVVSDVEAAQEETLLFDGSQAPEGDKDDDDALRTSRDGQTLLVSGERNATLNKVNDIEFHIDDSAEIHGNQKSSSNVEGDSAEVDISQAKKSNVKLSPEKLTDPKSGDRHKGCQDQESVTGIDSETQTDAVPEESQKKVPRKRKNISWGDEAAGGKLEQRLLVKKLGQFGEEQNFTEEDDEDDNEKEEPPAASEGADLSAQDGQRVKTARKGCGYICGECGKSFPFYCRFREHTKTHMLERPYICSVCPKSFRREGNLRMHQRRHRLELLAELGASPTSPDTALATPRVRKHAVRRGPRSGRAGSPGAPRLTPRTKITDEDSAAEQSDKEPVPCRLCDLVLWSADERKEHEVTCGQQRLMCRACGRTFRTAFSLWRHRLEVHHDSETFAFLPESPAAEPLSSPEAAAEREESAGAAEAVSEAVSDADKSEEIVAHSTPLPAVYLASASAAEPSAYSLLSLSDAAAAGSLQSDIPAETDSDKEAKAVSEILIVLGPALKDDPKTNEMLSAEEEKVECQDADTNFVTVEVNTHKGDGDGDDHNDDFQESQVESAIPSFASPESESPAVESGAEIDEDKTKPQPKMVHGLGGEEEELAHASCRKPRLVRLHPVSPAPRLRRDGAAKARQLKARAARADRRGAPLVTAADAESPPRPEPNAVAAAQDVEFPHTCTKCGVVFSLFQQLERHQELFCEVKAFQCHDCNKSFRTNFRLWSHRQSFHWDGDAAPESHSG
ncbi:uncharacterized protein LOC116954446 [Petromyzon marinus]|uniref:uncharacterized protein LOC116954446 n=1 Tax=Petromyzon marinus TaxID=7757 RepID=UPI003F70BBA3